MSTDSAVAVDLPWFCCHCSDAGIANHNLENQGFTVFWPRDWTPDPTQRHTSPQSLFGPYLFVQFDPTQRAWRTIPNTLGVRRLISLHSEYPLQVPWVALAPFLATYGLPGLKLHIPPPKQRIKKRSWRKLWEVDMIGAATA